VAHECGLLRTRESHRTGGIRVRVGREDQEGGDDDGRGCLRRRR
jgi:hypothetical protein